MKHNNIKNPPKGGNDDSWKFKPCRYKKTIIKKGNWKILPNGDLVIMERVSEIGFKTRKKTNGGRGKTTKQILLEFIDQTNSRFDRLEQRFDSLVKKNNLKDPNIK